MSLKAKLPIVLECFVVFHLVLRGFICSIFFTWYSHALGILCRFFSRQYEGKLMVLVLVFFNVLPAQIALESYLDYSINISVFGYVKSGYYHVFLPPKPCSVCILSFLVQSSTDFCQNLY